VREDDMSPEPVKRSFDYKSPFAYLVAEPAFALPARDAIELRRQRHN
jgi:hypothetical protein